MADQPSAWELVLQRMDRIESKVDHLGERVVPRDEFERYKVSAQKEHDTIRADLKQHKEKQDQLERDERKRRDEEASKQRLFWAGLILSPIAAWLVAWVTARGGF